MAPLHDVEAKPPRVVECPFCNSYVAASDDLCWACGTYLSPTAFEGQR